MLPFVSDAGFLLAREVFGFALGVNRNHVQIVPNREIKQVVYDKRFPPRGPGAAGFTPLLHGDGGRQAEREQLPVEEGRFRNFPDLLHQIGQMRGQR